MDVVLHGEIDPLRHKASVKDGVLNVKLFKKTPGTWGEFIASDDNGKAAEIKMTAVAEQQKLEKEMGDKRRDRKAQDERFSTRKQMAIEVRI